MEETVSGCLNAVLVFADIYSELKNNEFTLFFQEEKALSALQKIEEAELVNLAENISINPMYKLRFKVAKPNPTTLIGKGQLERLANLIEENGIGIAVFNNDLSPRVQRNLEEALNICVIDRREVIIQIFADRAKTKEAVLQSKLAEFEYLMPRLTRKWAGLSQQRGGVKRSRGAGEKKLELDKRRLRTEITKLKKEIEKVKTQRAIQRKSRIQSDKKIGAIVGYTNAGKSSLLKKLSGTEIFTEDKLFATLDAETRKIYLPDGSKILLTDTVGFVSNLPHQLIDSFRSTLEEAALADFLIIVCDASHPAMLQCLSVTEKILQELNCTQKEKIILINKTDCIFDHADVFKIKDRFPDALEISVKTGKGIDSVKEKLLTLCR